MVTLISILIKKSPGGAATKVHVPIKQQLIDNLHKPIIRNFQKSNVVSTFMHDMSVTDLADM